MDERYQNRQLRKNLGASSWALLIYWLIMNACVLVAILIQSLMLNLNGGMTVNEIESALAGNFWGYLVCCVLSIAGMLLWKGKKITFGAVWTRGKPMRFGDLIVLFCLMMAAQVVFSIVSSIQEVVFNLFGLSARKALESATQGADTFSAFLYTGLGAPIIEEWIFRGVILRSLQPWGKKTAILISAMLFGLFHGNFVQTPFAFLVGLVLGYTAVEYSIGWAMVLHMINNLVLGDLLPRLLNPLGGLASDAVGSLLFYGATIAAIVVLIVKRKQIRAYFAQEKLDDRAFNCFFSAAGTITLTVFMLIQAILSIQRL